MKSSSIKYTEESIDRLEIFTFSAITYLVLYEQKEEVTLKIQLKPKSKTVRTAGPSYLAIKLNFFNKPKVIERKFVYGNCIKGKNMKELAAKKSKMNYDYN